MLRRSKTCGKPTGIGKRSGPNGESVGLNLVCRYDVDKYYKQGQGSVSIQCTLLTSLLLIGLRNSVVWTVLGRRVRQRAHRSAHRLTRRG